MTLPEVHLNSAGLLDIVDAHNIERQVINDLQSLTDPDFLENLDGRYASVPSGPSSHLLARVLYNPTVQASYLVATAGAPPVDIDPINLAITFTLPDSGKIRVTLSGTYLSSGGSNYSWSLRKGGVDVPGSDRLVPIAGAGTIRSYAYHVIPLLGNPGETVTYTWAHRATNAYPTLYAGGAEFVNPPAVAHGPAIMEVYAE